jgi:site-specific DNA recombinase
LRAGWRHDQALVDAIQSVGAQEEVAKLVERNRIGMIGRIKRGEFSRGPIYGYQLFYAPDGTRQIVINPEQAAIVREVFRLYLDGVGMEGVGEILTQRGHTSPTGQAWTEGGVRTVLENGWKYAGHAEINRDGKHKRELVRAPAMWEAIVDEETVRMFEEERAARSVNRRLPGTTDKLAGVCYCAVCGQSMHVQDCTRVWNGVEHIYCYRRCIRHKPNVNIRLEIIEAALRSEIAMLQGVDIDEMVGDVPDVLEPLRRQIDEAESARKRMAAALQRADDAYIDGLMNEERYQAQVSRLQAQITAGEKEQERLKERINQENDRGSRRQRIADVRDYGLARLDDPDVQAANLWLRRHVRIYCASRIVVGVIWL